MRDLVLAFLRSESGATAIEYGLIAGLIFLAIIVGVQSVGPNLVNKFTSVSAGLN